MTSRWWFVRPEFITAVEVADDDTEVANVFVAGVREPIPHGGDLEDLDGCFAIAAEAPR